MSKEKSKADEIKETDELFDYFMKEGKFDTQLQGKSNKQMKEKLNNQQPEKSENSKHKFNKNSPSSNEKNEYTDELFDYFMKKFD